MEVIENSLKIGDWVRLVDSHIEGCKGYIVRHDEEDNTYKVKITQLTSGKP